MTAQFRKASVAIVAGITLAAAFMGTNVGAQKLTPAEIAAKFTGTWKMNRELSPAVSGGARRGGGAQPLYEVGFFSEFQRGGGGGAPGGQVSEGERAGQAAMRALQQLGDPVTINASVDSITFKDARGERTYAIGDKSVRVELAGGAFMNTKSRWDKNTLKQEFIYGETKLQLEWVLDASGDRLNFKMQILNMSAQQPPTEAKVVYDRVKA